MKQYPYMCDTFEYSLLFSSPLPFHSIPLYFNFLRSRTHVQAYILLSFCNEKVKYLAIYQENNGYRVKLMK